MDLKTERNLDECLIDLYLGRKPTLRALIELPIWRQVIVTRISVIAGVMGEEEADGIIKAAKSKVVAV